MTFSVIIVTYNQSFESVKITLNSILRQSFKDYEIVISDDGSKENHFEKIEEYLLANKFEKYKLIANKVNQGTVKNLLTAVEAADGKYIKDLGPGDLLYDSSTLSKIYEFMENSMYKASFGLMRGYFFDTNRKVQSFDFVSPFDIEAYRSDNSNERILKNLICYGDNVYGAAVCMTPEFALRYLNMIKDVVIYVEDLYQVISSLEGNYIGFIDDYTVWYESKSGISNKGSQGRYSEKMRADTTNFFKMIYELFPDNKYVKRRKKYGFLYVVKNLYLRTMIRFLINPDALRYMIYHYIQVMLGKHGKKNRNKGFLDEKNFIEEIEWK
ncbi:MAG: glycosyltransferase family 2 protein [Eubacteriales bacterium]|nr:glycosyltransferase family 2 protein [Eubacteriales bacterium]